MWCLEFLPVWDYFRLCAANKGKVIDEGITVCCRCSSNVCASGNMSNWLLHLRMHHPSQYTQVLQSQKCKAKENEKPSNASLLSATDQASTLNCLPEGTSMKNLRDDGKK